MCKVPSSPMVAGCIAAILVLTSVPAIAKTAAPRAATTSTPSLVAQRQSAQPSVIYATGEGAMPSATKEPNRAKAYLQAKTYAKMQAVANLLQAARGTFVTYHATGQDFVADEVVSQEVKGVAANVQVVSERKKQEGKDTIVEVTVSAPVPAAWKTAAKPAAKARTSAPVGTQVASARPGPGWTAKPSAAKLVAKEAPYTSLILNASGLRVARSMSPKILREDGSEVWGTVKVNYDFVADHGIVAYAVSTADARSNKRAGENPMVLRAVSRGGSPYGGDVVISDEDADYLLAEDRRSGFLADFRVVFVVDPSR